MVRARSILIALLLLAATGACSLLQDPAKPWRKDLLYDEGPNGELIVSPTEIKVDGPWGFIVVTNETGVKRGFAMDDASVFEEIRSENTRSVRVDELEDGQTYTFYDHVEGERTSVLGTVVVRYVDEDQR